MNKRDKNKQKCPECRSKEVIPIIYGLPTYDTWIKAEKGKLLIGGCCFSDYSPKWHCKNCSYDWK